MDRVKEFGVSLEVGDDKPGQGLGFRVQGLEQYESNVKSHGLRCILIPGELRNGSGQ